MLFVQRDDLEFRMKGSGSRGLRLKVQGVGFAIEGARLRVFDGGFRV